MIYSHCFEMLENKLGEKSINIHCLGVPEGMKNHHPINLVGLKNEFMALLGLNTQDYLIYGSYEVTGCHLRSPRQGAQQVEG